MSSNRVIFLVITVIVILLAIWQEFFASKDVSRAVEQVPTVLKEEPKHTEEIKLLNEYQGKG